jgi:hypothetical protein
MDQQVHERLPLASQPGEQDRDVAESVWGEESVWAESVWAEGEELLHCSEEVVMEEELWVRALHGRERRHSFPLQLNLTQTACS